MQGKWNRRDVLKGVAAMPLLSALGAAPPPARAAPVPMRRVRPGDRSWPSEAQWRQLQRDVGGRLVAPKPLAADCAAAPDGAACRLLERNLRNPYFIGDQVSGTQVSGWLDAWSPSISARAVAARTTADVVAAVNFARTRNLRLAVKGGGHSYQGTSNAPDSLLIWTRAMQAIEMHERFTAQGGAALQAPLPAVTVAAGALWGDVYDAVTTKGGRYVQGGGCTTVGVAGLIQSGGFGSFSKRYGLAAASLLEAQVVTADGIVRTANAYMNPDLFWALKGGGGGSFGVLTRLTLRTHELPARFGAVSAKIKAASTAAFLRLIGRFVEFYAGSLFNPHWGESVTIGADDTLDISLVSEGYGGARQAAIWRPFSDWIDAAPGDFKYVEPRRIASLPARQWWDFEARRKRGSDAMIADPRAGAPPAHAWWAGDQAQVGAYIDGYDSVWLPAALLRERQRAQLAEALFAASRAMDVRLHFNKGLAGAPAGAIAAARGTAINPAVLGAFALALVAAGRGPQYPGLPDRRRDTPRARRHAAGVDAAAAQLRKIVPDAGSYLSESDYFNRSWQQAFWGANYVRLRAVKDKYDPLGLFTVHHGVGSEAWSADGFVRTG